VTQPDQTERPDDERQHALDRMTMDYPITFDVLPDAETKPAQPDRPR
jgi:hypothetical protein